MIIFDLACQHDHRFECWFQSREDFDSQLASGLIACPHCGSLAIRRIPSAVHLASSAPVPAAVAAKPAAATPVIDMQAAKPIFDYPKYWAECFGPAPFLPMSREEMDQLGWDSCDIIIVTGDAYVDHPSFGMAIIGRLLESQGFRVGIIAQPNWQSKDDFMKLGEPNLFFGVAAGNMDSMINRYTADRKIRSDDAYTPGDVGGKRPDRAAIVYSQRCREA